MAEFLDRMIVRLSDPNIDSRAAWLALTNLERDQKKRIHQKGLASDNSPLRTFAKRRFPAGRYSLQHGRKRDQKGRRTDIKNLDFTGDLRRNLRGYGVGTFKGKPAYGFFQDKFRIIANGQQAQTRQDIWGMSKQEEDNVVEIYTDELLEDILK